MKAIKRRDRNRRQVQIFLKREGIDNLSLPGHQELSDYLLDPKNNISLQQYFIICSGSIKPSDAHQKLTEIIKEMRFRNDGYTYRDLFSMDQEWESFFRENAYPHPSGQRRNLDDARLGVDKEKVDSIMKLKSGPPILTLEDAITMACLNALPEDAVLGTTDHKL